MRADCCVSSVPHHGSFETFGRPVAAWAERLSVGLSRSVQASDQTLGHLEEEILQQTHELERALLAEAAQQKADATPPVCPVCGHKLSRRTRGHERTYQTRFGPITLQRLRGWCRRCRAWRFPADHTLGVADTGGASPTVQELAALAVSKMPVAEAGAVLERMAGVKLPRATLDREARRQGRRAERERARRDEQMRTAAGVGQSVPALQRVGPGEPFTLVIEMDAWNIRERDDWGQTETRRAAGEEPSRWHWVYGGTCFRLSQRAQTHGGRALILSRGTVMTRGGVDALKEQLWAEAMRHGLAEASDVVVIGDGAVWIWHAADDRFAGARQRLDPWHAVQHLWTVARVLYPQDETAAQAWVRPLREKLLSDASVEVITDLNPVLARLRGAKRQAVAAEWNYLESHRDRLDYAAARQRGEPQGSGAMESTCRQYQCRFKRPGQFWSRSGDEALMCLETFWRNGRWRLLFPHVPPSFDLSRN
jgi:hypothetical protein